MEGFRRLAPALVLVLLSGPVLAIVAPAKEPGGDAESSYQSGVDQYAHGRFAQARTDFEKALRLDPSHRAARAALERIRVEHDFTVRGAPPPSPSPARLSADSLRAEADDAPLAGLARFLRFERTVGDAREDLGRLEALQGRIAQLSAERRAARARGRTFARENELRALARRLPEVAS